MGRAGPRGGREGHQLCVWLGFHVVEGSLGSAVCLRLPTTAPYRSSMRAVTRRAGAQQEERNGTGCGQTNMHPVLMTGGHSAPRRGGTARVCQCEAAHARGCNAGWTTLLNVARP